MAFNRKRKYIRACVLLMFLIAVASVVYFVSYGINIMKGVAATSYIASVGSFLHYNTKTKKIREIASNLGETWRFLNELEYIKLSKAINRSNVIDRGGLSHDPNRILFDHWNRHILIADMKSYGSEPEFILWSKGPDGIFRTKDDTASPCGTLPPVTLRE